MRKNILQGLSSVVVTRVGVSWRSCSCCQGFFCVTPGMNCLHCEQHSVCTVSLLSSTQMMSRKPVISINELGRERELLQQSPRDCRVARYRGDSSNRSYNITEHKWGSPYSQPIGPGLFHGAVHLPTIKTFLLGLDLSIMAHCIISIL